MNRLLIAKNLGILLMIFSGTMLFMVPFALWFQEWEQLFQIGKSIAFSAIFGFLLYLTGRHAGGDLYRREALALVGLSWLAVAALGALPFYLGGMVSSYTDAYFEAMSGVTTTGATILTSMEPHPKSLLFWRSFLQFLGGMGIIVFFVAILPVLGVGGKTLFKQEVPGPLPEGLTPRIKDTALNLCKIYIGLNLIEVFLLLFGGLSLFDAINHAMTTMATGGFSTKTSSVGHFSVYVEWVVILFMFIGGANFSLHLRLLKGDWKAYWRNTEFKAYIAIVVSLALFFTAILYLAGTTTVSNPGGINFRDALFATLTILTTTGFGTQDFDQWPEVCRLMLVLLMFVGGSAGSTAGGMKIIRWVILIKSAGHQLSSQARPRVVKALKIGGQALDRSTAGQVFAFFFIYISIFVFASLAVAFLSPAQDLITTITAVAACINNIGPALEAVGPTMNYADQNSLAKWILALCMILGRIELYAVLVLFTPSFWSGK